MTANFNSDVLQELNSPEAQQLHGLTKELTRIGVGNIVDLPQIVVFGGQNAGKSSVLEAISHIRFPIDSGLCTRFATELELKHGPEPRIRASVKFAASRETKTLSYDGFNESDLPDIIKKAKEEMGISGSEKRFTKDILRLDIEGPSMYPLQLVDLPGVFEVTSEEQTEQDKRTVKELVDSYLNQKNSIVMMVIASETDYHMQSTLEKLKKFDEAGGRTIGIITKPDKATSDEIRKPYIELALNQNDKFKLKLGWHVMRNRDTKDENHDFAARDSAEANFFEESSWARIPRGNRGVNSLRVRLSKIQFDHLRHSIPTIIQEMKTKLAERDEELERLGPARPNRSDMRNFLNRKADSFQQLAKEAVEGRYHEAFFRRSPDQYKLRAQLRNFSAAFDYTLRAKGADRIVVKDEDEDEDEKQEDDASSEESEDYFELPEYLEDFLEANPYPFADPEECTFSELSEELNKEAAKTRGLEFPGSTNDNLALRLFQRQSRKWEGIAQHHIDLVAASARLFVEKAIEYLVGPADTNFTTNTILHTIVDDFFEKRERSLKDKLEELICPYREAYALPIDRDFIQLKKTKAAARYSHHGGDFAPNDVVSVMETYYELSRRTFTDNIINLAVESCLVRHIPHIFTPTSVGEMSDETVEKLAKESEDVITRREDLEVDKDKLTEALKYCNKYRPRNSPDNSQTNTITRGSSPASSGKKDKSSAKDFGSKPTVPSPGGIPFGAGSSSNNPSTSSKSGPSLFPSSSPPSDKAASAQLSPLPLQPSSGGLFGGAKASSNVAGTGQSQDTSPHPKAAHPNWSTRFPFVATKLGRTVWWR
ncbi:hypothetical protein NLG97_g7225 [Lecanicillium saksenae]|uniref:Uncharacterized protein n=1 Tax=Lecanicillium saksenae TaxID=468837 RepID=A0ACC1QMF5_9HYPO|nr:hypothetical protein NLG97_g7225 [Lecanicillium saksenae]